MSKCVLSVYAAFVCFFVISEDTSVFIKTKEPLQRRASYSLLKAIVDGLELKGVTIVPDLSTVDKADLNDASREYVLAGTVEKSKSKDDLSSIVSVYANIVFLVKVDKDAAVREKKKGGDDVRSLAVTVAKVLGDSQIAAKPGPYPAAGSLTMHYRLNEEWKQIPVSVDFSLATDKLVDKLNANAALLAIFDVKLSDQKKVMLILKSGKNMVWYDGDAATTLGGDFKSIGSIGKAVEKTEIVLDIKLPAAPVPTKNAQDLTIHYKPSFNDQTLNFDYTISTETLVSDFNQDKKFAQFFVAVKGDGDIFKIKSKSGQYQVYFDGDAAKVLADDDTTYIFLTAKSEKTAKIFGLGQGSNVPELASAVPFPISKQVLKVYDANAKDAGEKLEDRKQLFTIDIDVAFDADKISDAINRATVEAYGAGTLLTDWSDTISGTNTDFEKELKKGDSIFLGEKSFVVAAVLSKSQIKVTAKDNPPKGSFDKFKIVKQLFFADVSSDVLTVRAMPGVAKSFYFGGSAADRLGGDFAAAKSRETAIRVATKAADTLQPFYLTAHYDADLDSIVLEGIVPSQTEKDAVLAHVKEYTDKAKVVNHIIANPPVVEVNVDVLSVLALRSTGLGANILGTQGTGIGVTTTADFLINKTFLPHLSAAGVKLDKSDSTFKAAHQLNANTTTDIFQVIASPFLSAQSGTKATFRQGGEVGVQALSTGVATIEYRPFGFVLEVLPTVQFDGQIACEVSIEQSAPTQTVNKAGVIQFAIANTHNNVNIREGQSLVLSGISSDSKDKQKAGVPVLRSVPGLSFFFSDKNDIRQSNDLVIVLTPHVKYSKIERSAYACRKALASQNAIARINDEKNAWSQREGDKINRMLNTQDYLSNGEIVDIIPSKEFEARRVKNPAVRLTQGAAADGSDRSSNAEANASVPRAAAFIPNTAPTSKLQDPDDKRRDYDSRSRSNAFDFRR